MTQASSRYPAWAGCFSHLPLATVLIAAVALRLWGIDFGLPHTLVRPDEDAVASVALRFFRRTMNPGFFDWPSLFMYVVAAGYAAYFNIGRLLGWFPYEASFVAAAGTYPAPLFLVARGLSATAGVLTVGTVYCIGARLFDRTTALLGAAFMAVAALHVRDSHFGLTDVTATWLLATSFLFTVKYVQTGRSSDALVSALWAGLAASTKYNAGAAVLPGIWAIVRHGAGEERKTPAAGIQLVFLYVAVAAAAFVIGTPYAALDPRSFLTSLRDVGAHLQGGHTALAGYAWPIHLTSSLRFGLGVPMLTAGICGLVLYCWRDRRAGLLFTMLPVAYFGLIGAGQTAFARHIIPTLPFLCLGAARFTVQTSEAIGRWSLRLARPALALLSVVVATPSLWSAIQTDRLLSRTDTRLLAAQWIHDQFPRGATIYQSGSIYGHVQMQTSDRQAFDRYQELTFDELSDGFYTANGVRTALPQLIILTRCLLPYCDIPVNLSHAMSEYVPLQTLMAVDPNHRGLRYDRDDAFFVPLAGLDGALRAGPDLLIFGHREASEPARATEADPIAAPR